MCATIACQYTVSTSRRSPRKCCYPLLVYPLFKSEMPKKSVSARPGPILEGTLGTRMGPGRGGMGPTSGPGWVRNTVKQTRDRTWTGPGSDQARVWMAPQSMFLWGVLLSLQNLQHESTVSPLAGNRGHNMGHAV